MGVPQNSCTYENSFKMSKEYKTISLAPQLKAEKYNNSQQKTSFKDVLLKYGREADEVARKSEEQSRRRSKNDTNTDEKSSRVHVENRTPVLGGSTTSTKNVHTNGNYGFFSAVLESYNNHWALRTTPEDWWYTIIYKIARAIDKSSAKPSVRDFFVSHEGKKQLTVKVGPSVYGVDYAWFLNQMTQQIADNIKVSQYVDALKSDFSTSTDCHVICSEISVMASLQEYFEYRMYLSCGIPAIEMEGTVENICDRLVETYEGNVDTEWWSKIFSTRQGFVSGGQPPTFYEGWFITEFLGLKNIDSLSNLQNGIITVPMTLTDGDNEEQSAFAAGIAGYEVFQNEGENATKWPSVKVVHSWGLLLEPNSLFRTDLQKWEAQLTSGA